MAYHTFNLFKDELNKSKINQALPSYNDFKLARYMLKFVQSKPQIFKQTICEIINKSTYPQSPALLPSLLQNGYPRDVINLLVNIKLAKQIKILLLRFQNRMFLYFYLNSLICESQASKGPYSCNLKAAIMPPQR